MNIKNIIIITFISIAATVFGGCWGIQKLYCDNCEVLNEQAKVDPFGIGGGHCYIAVHHSNWDLDPGQKDCAEAPNCNDCPKCTLMPCICCKICDEFIYCECEGND